jgi:hypothetical protein
MVATQLVPQSELGLEGVTRSVADWAAQVTTRGLCQSNIRSLVTPSLFCSVIMSITGQDPFYINQDEVEPFWTIIVSTASSILCVAGFLRDSC